MECHHPTEAEARLDEIAEQHEKAEAASLPAEAEALLNQGSHIAEEAIPLQDFRKDHAPNQKKKRSSLLMMKNHDEDELEMTRSEIMKKSSTFAMTKKSSTLSRPDAIDEAEELDLDASDDDPRDASTVCGDDADYDPDATDDVTTDAILFAIEADLAAVESTNASIYDVSVDGLCKHGCGRQVGTDVDAASLSICCQSCHYLTQRGGTIGHDCVCDVRHNGGMAVPWYWRTSTGESRSEEDSFHDELEGNYVQRMGTKLIQHSMPEMLGVGKCLRVQDSKLWANYATRRAEIRSRQPPPLETQPATLQLLEYSASTTVDKTANETWLFHGTSEDAAKSIAKNDFALPSSAGNFGKGLYFTDTATKAHTYAKKNSDGYFIMMLCRVTLGQVLEITGKDKKAESMIQATENDSISGVADGRNREFIVYDGCQVYPEYIMYYQKEETEADRRRRNQRKRKYLGWEIAVLAEKQLSFQANDVDSATRSTRLKSHEFELQGRTGKFRVYYYPKGYHSKSNENKQAQEGFCSLYIWSKYAATMQVRVWVNNHAKLLDRSGPKEWRAGSDKGWLNFCKAPSGKTSVNLQLLNHLDHSDCTIPAAPARVAPDGKCPGCEKLVLAEKCFVFHANEVACATRGTKLKTSEFEFHGRAGKFRLYYYPKGYHSKKDESKRAQDGFCSLYLWSKEAATMQVRLWVNDQAKLLKKNGPDEWKPGRDRGWGDFCVAPLGGTEVKVQLLDYLQQPQSAVPVAPVIAAMEEPPTFDEEIRLENLATPRRRCCCALQ